MLLKKEAKFSLNIFRKLIQSVPARPKLASVKAGPNPPTTNYALPQKNEADASALRFVLSQK